MKLMRSLCVLVAMMLCSGIQASEYFRGYDVNQPQVRKPSTQRALEYERAQNANIKARVASFYNRLKAAAGFQPAVQQRPRVSEYERAYAPVSTTVSTVAQPRGHDLAKAYEADARKDYKTAKRAYKFADEAQVKAWDAKNKAWDSKSDAWAKRSSVYEKPAQYAARDREYQAAMKAEEARGKDYSGAREAYLGAWDRYSKDRSAYQAIRDANKPKLSNQDFERLLREAEARADARRFYPWYR